MTGRQTGEQVDFHFDVMCPWAYQSAVWIREVRRQTGLEISWRFFSLEEINRQEGKKHPWERPWSYGWSLLRVAALLRRHSMDDVDRFYDVAGRWLHVEGRKPHTPEGRGRCWRRSASTLRSWTRPSPTRRRTTRSSPTTSGSWRRRLRRPDALLRRLLHLRPGRRPGTDRTGRGAAVGVRAGVAGVP